MTKHRESWINVSPSRIFFMKQVDSRLLWVDAIRVIAIFLVIVIHVSAGVVTSWNSEPSFSWWIAHIYNSISRSSVALFVLISGALLLGKSESIKAFITKRISRVVLPWGWWVGSTILLDFIFKFNQTGFEHGIKGFIQHYFITGFWFIPLVIQLYLLVPVLRLFTKKISLAGLTAIGGCLAVLVSLQSTYCGVTNTCSVWPLPLGIQYLGYFILGYAFLHFSLQKWQVFLLSVFWFLSVAWIVVGTYQLSIARGSFSEVYYHYLSIPVAMSACSAFLILKTLFSKKPVPVFPSTRLVQLSSASFGIYLVHALLIKIISATPLKLLFTHLSDWAVVGIPLVSLLIFGFSFVVILLMHRSKFFKIFSF